MGYALEDIEVVTTGTTFTFVACGFCGLYQPCSCKAPEPVTVPHAVPQPSKHLWGEMRGTASFCSRCGAYYTTPDCFGWLGLAVREQNIEWWIADHQRANDGLRAIRQTARKPGLAWSNISAALNAPPGWNRRGP